LTLAELNSALPSSKTSSLPGLVEGIRHAGSAPLSEATSLPPAAYHSAELFALEVERLFRPGWVAVARSEVVAAPGSYHATDLADERLVLTRDRGGALHVLSRVCRHRSMELVEGTGRAATLSCPYHRWTYTLSGELVGAPLMGSAAAGVEGCRLPEFAAEEWGGFVWVNLDRGAEPLAPRLETLEAQLATAGIDLTDQVVIDRTDWGEQPWDWKVMVDNFMECYHHLGPHRDSLQAAYPAELAWTDTGSDTYSLMHTVPAPEPPEAASTGWPTGDPMRGEAGCLVHVYPLAMCSARPSGTNVLRVVPLGPGRMHLVTEMLAPLSVRDRSDFPEILAARRATFVRINEEDLAACAAVQCGLATPSARPGRLSPLEQPLWEFIRDLAAGLTKAPLAEAEPAQGHAGGS
jgi:phenylpropionate dioxygenase-like ring-hydroxylating dioxygenase large terminal subunit